MMETGHRTFRRWHDLIGSQEVGELRPRLRQQSLSMAVCVAVQALCVTAGRSGKHCPRPLTFPAKSILRKECEDSVAGVPA